MTERREPIIAIPADIAEQMKQQVFSDENLHGDNFNSLNYCLYDTIRLDTLNENRFQYFYSQPVGVDGKGEAHTNNFAFGVMPMGNTFDVHSVHLFCIGGEIPHQVKLGLKWEFRIGQMIYETGDFAYHPFTRLYQVRRIHPNTYFAVSIGRIDGVECPGVKIRCELEGILYRPKQ